MTKSRDIFSPWLAFSGAFLAALIFALTCRYPGYVHHDTAEIAMWSTLGWPLGLPKHPPFLPWLFRAYSNVVPLNWISLDVLTAANIVLGAWAVWRIALLVLDERRASLALMLYGLAPAGTFFALKLNHNAILVALWPLTILAFLSCLRAERMTRSLAWGVAFGVLAAVSMLAKYYSGVLLACCFAASLVSSDRNRFYTMPGGYAAVAAFAALIAPHALWMLDNQGATLAYALHETEREAYPLAHFLAVTPTYLLPSLAAFWALQRLERHSSPAGVREQTVNIAFGPVARVPNELKVLAIGPFVLTALFIALFKLRGATSWSLPDFCVVPVLLAALLPAISDDGLARGRRIAGAALVVIALAGPVVLIAAFALRDGNAIEPRAELAAAAGRIYTASTGTGPRIVAGEPKLANTAALDIPSRPRAFTNFNLAFAPWVTLDALAREGLLVLCNTSDMSCRNSSAAVVPDQVRFVCELALQRRWFGLVGRFISAHIVVVPGQGAGFNPVHAAAACTTEGGSVPGLIAKP